MGWYMSGLDHYDEELAALDKRIGRLALLCGADLSREEVLIHLIKGQFDACPQPANVDKTHLQELQALLMMKYKIEVSCIHWVRSNAPD
jgi:hypothetical protein